MSAEQNLLTASLVAYFRLIRSQAIAEVVNRWTRNKSGTLEDAFSLEGSLEPNDLKTIISLLPLWLAAVHGDVREALAGLFIYEHVRTAFQSVDDPEVHEIIARLPVIKHDQARYRPRDPALFRGGHGEVRAAEDTELDGRVVAFKQPRSDQDDPDARRRFMFEGQVTGRLEHPGIVPVYGLGFHEGRPYYAMRFVGGATFTADIRVFHDRKSTADPPSRSVQFRRLLNRFGAVCDTVAFAHEQGILHCDLKPENIRCGEHGETWVLDWGCAKRFTREQGSGPSPNTTCAPGPALELTATGVETSPGHLLGTPGYRSPEMTKGRLDDANPRTADVYSLGATLYHLLTGFPPADAIVSSSAGESSRSPGIPALKKIRKHIPSILDAICRKAMAPSPTDRYPSASALKDDIDRWLADAPVSCYNPWRVRIDRWIRRYWLGVATAFAFLLVVGGSYAVIQKETEQRRDVERRGQEDKAFRRQELMAHLDKGNHSPEVRVLSARVVADYPTDPAVQLVPAALALLDAQTPSQHTALADMAQALFADKQLPSKEHYVSMFAHCVELHDLLCRLINQTGGLAPGQRDKMKQTEDSLLDLFQKQPQVAEATREVPTLQRLLRTISVLNRTSNVTRDALPPFDEIQIEHRWLSRQADSMEELDQGDWDAELHYQLAACHLARVQSIVNFIIPDKRKRELQTDSKRMKEELDHRAGLLVRELLRTAEVAHRARGTRATVNGPLVRLKARTLEATASVTLLRFAPQLEPRLLDEAQMNLSTFRSDTADAPVDAQLFSRMSLLSLMCIPLSSDQYRLWADKPNEYRERIRRVNLLGSVLLLEWEGAETVHWLSQPQTWDRDLENRFSNILEVHRQQGAKVSRDAMSSPVSASRHIRAILADGLQQWYQNELQWSPQK